MEHVAEVSGVDPVEVRRLNFLKAYPPMAAAPQMHPSAAARPSTGSRSQVHAVPRHTTSCQSILLINESVSMAIVNCKNFPVALAAPPWCGGGAYMLLSLLPHPHQS